MPPHWGYGDALKGMFSFLGTKAPLLHSRMSVWMIFNYVKLPDTCRTTVPYVAKVKMHPRASISETKSLNANSKTIYGGIAL